MGYKFLGIDANDLAGVSVSPAGDIDGDGLGDVLIGAGKTTLSSVSESGEAYLVLSTDMAALDAADGTADGLIQLSNIVATGGSYLLRDNGGFNNRLATSVAEVGDMDGDGRSELLLGGPDGSSSASGVTYLLNPKDLASLDAADGTVDRRIDLDRVSPGTGSYVFSGEASGDKSGRQVSSAGDVDGDGKADLLIGADRGDAAAGDAGQAYLINANDLAALDAADGTTDGKISLSQVAATGTSYRFLGEALGDRAGFDVSSVGDIDGDGKSEFLITAELALSGPMLTGTGRTYLVSGNELANLDAADGTTDGNISLANVEGAANSFKFIGGPTIDFDATIVSGAGDLDNDGKADLLIADSRSGGFGGRAHVVNGADLAALDAADGTTDGVIALTNAAPTGTSYTFLPSGAIQPQLGLAVSGAGDVDGDGLGDVLVSESSNLGTTHLIFGKDLAALDSADGLTDGFIQTALVPQTGSGKTFFGEALFDQAGASVSGAGDVDGDGKADLLVGATGVENGINPDTGAAYLLKAALLDVYDARDGFMDGSILLAQSVFDHDTTAPPAPVVTKITTDSGASSTDRITSDTTLVIEGTAEPGAQVTVFGNGASLTGATPVTADGAGNWSYDHTGTTLPEGNFSITAQAKDAAGNTGSVSAAFVVTVDTSAPTAPVVTGISDDDGVSPSDGVTTDQTLQINGTAEANASVEVFLDGTSIGTAAANGAGAWSFDHSGTTLPLGSYAITARATDVAGNTSVNSAAFTATVQAPSAPSLSAVDLVDASDDGASSTDDKTSDLTPTINYTAEAGATVEIDFGDGAGFAAVGAGTGAPQSQTLGTAYASEGTKTVQVRATNATGQQTTQTLDIMINRKPTDVALTGGAIAQGAAAGTVVGSLGVVDSTPGDSRTLQLTDSAGGLFVLNGSNIEVAAGATIDTASGAIKTIGVRATDCIGGTVDKALSVTVLTSGGVITDGDGAATLTGDATANTINAGGGDDTVIGGAAGDDITLGAGRDTVQDSAANMDGDRVNDFSQADRLVFTGAGFSEKNISTSESGGVTKLAIDADGDGTTDATVDLVGSFTGGAFMAASHSGNTAVSFVKLLPTLAEGVALPNADINGVANPDFLIGDGTKTFQITLDAAAVASFQNAIGVYEVNAGGDIVDVSIVFADASASGGTSVTLASVEAGHSLGAFLLQDGAGFAQALAATDRLSFVDSSGAPANVNTGTSAELAVNGTASGQTVFHSFAAHLNPDGLQHATSGTNAVGDRLLFGFEDQTGAGDMDYQDVLFGIEIL